MVTRKAKAIQRNQKWIAEYKKTLKCKYCKEQRSVALDFHHRDPSNKKAKVSALVSDSYSLATIKAEIAKCDVICSNCHRVLHYNINRDKREAKKK